MLYDSDFKKAYTHSLVQQYPKVHRNLLDATSKNLVPPLARALDRITVQLFNTAVRCLFLHILLFLQIIEQRAQAGSIWQSADFGNVLFCHRKALSFLVVSVNDDQGGLLRNWGLGIA